MIASKHCWSMRLMQIGRQCAGGMGGRTGVISAFLVMAVLYGDKNSQVFCLAQYHDPLAISSPKRFSQVSFSDGSGRGSSLANSSAGVAL